ncbi:putative cell wall hydrolase LytN [Bienertia sinuspersici]
MLVFGMGLYELFVSNLDIAKAQSKMKNQHQSNLFGLFTLRERPKWLEIKSVDELKTKVGHVIVMLLLIGLFDNSKKAAIHTTTDLLCFAASVLLCSCCLYMLSKLDGSN